MASTFDRLFGVPQVEGVNAALAERTTAILPNGPWENQPVRSSRKSCPAKSIATGLSEENVPPDSIFGSRKKRIEEPGKVSGVGVSAALSPRNKGWSGNPRTERCREAMEPGDKDLFSPSCRPLRRRFPSADKGTVPLPPWLSVGDCSPPSARSASPRSDRRSPRWERSRSPSPSSPVRPTSPQDRRVLQWTSGYELDSYRQIKVFPDNVQQQSCAALKPANAAKFSKEEEHDRIIGPDGTLKPGCKRRISPNSRCTVSSIAFTPPPTPEESASPTSPVREPLQGLQSARNGDANFSLPTQIPRKRLQPSESPTQSESWTTPVAGMASPRFSWAADMVPDLKEAPGTGRCLSPRSPTRCSRSPHDVVSPPSLIRSNATLGTGLYAEEPQSMLENFLGARKGRSPASRSRGASPLASPYRNDAGESLGFGTLSWGKVSSGGAAGGYGLDVAAGQAAGRFHGSGTLNQALNARVEDITFKEPFMRHRQKVLEQRAQSPLRWR